MTSPAVEVHDTGAGAELVLQRRPGVAVRLLAGGVAGLAATLPMTAVMVRMFRDLRPDEKHLLPPRHITEELTEGAGLAEDLSENQKTALTLASHFAYGAAAGSVYGMAASYIKGRPLLTGVAFGLAVWGGSYAGWLPAAGILPPAGDESAGRNRLMIVAHAVWGAATGLCYQALAGSRRSAVRHET